MAAAFGIVISSRFSPESFLTFVAGRFGGSEFWRGVDFVAQQTMLRCATKGWVVAQGGWWGVSSKERSAHLFIETRTLLVELLFNTSLKFNT